MTRTEQVNELKETWEFLLPGTEVPPDRQFAIWSLMHDTEVIEQGFAELATKLSRLSGQMSLDHMIRFSSAIMSRITRADRA